MQTITPADDRRPGTVWFPTGTPSKLSKSVMIYLALKFIDEAKSSGGLNEWPAPGRVIKIDPDSCYYDPTTQGVRGPPMIIFDGRLHVCKDEDDFVDTYLETRFLSHVDLTTEAEQYFLRNPGMEERISRGIKLVDEKMFYGCCRAAIYMDDNS